MGKQAVGEEPTATGLGKPDFDAISVDTTKVSRDNNRGESP